MSKKKLKSLGLYSFVLILSIIFVLSSILVMILLVIKKDNSSIDKIATISITQSDEFDKKSIDLTSNIAIDEKIFSTEKVMASISANQNSYLRVLINFEFNFNGTNLDKRYDADIEENLHQIANSFPFVSGQYNFTLFNDGYFYLTNTNGYPIPLSQLHTFYNVATEKYNFTILNFSSYILDNSLSIFKSNTYQYYDYNLCIELQTLNNTNLITLDNSALQNLSCCYKEKFIYYHNEVKLHYDNVLGYYLCLGVYPYDFDTVALRGRKIKWLALNYCPENEQDTTFYSEHILDIKIFSESYDQSENIYTNTQTGAYANDYYGSDIRAYLTSEEFLYKYSINVEDATYKAIISQNMLDIFENSVDYLNGDFVATSNIDALSQYNSNFSSESDKFVLLNYNDISLFNYASFGNYSPYSSDIPINYNNDVYNYENFIFSLANFLKNNLDLVLQDEYNLAIYDCYFNQPYGEYESIYEEVKSNTIYEDLSFVTDEEFIRMYYFLHGNVYINEEGNPANGVDDVVSYLLKWNSSYALISKTQKFLKQFTDSKIAILMSSEYNLIEYCGIDQVGRFFNWGTLSPVSTNSIEIYTVYDFGIVGTAWAAEQPNGVRPAFKINL